MNPQTCPAQRVLEQLLLGRLDPVEAADLERHLTGCMSCSETLHGLTTRDELIEALRGAKSSADADAEVSAILDRMHNALFVSEGGDSAVSGSPSAESRVASDNESPLDMLREYRLLAKLGEGGMGSVYKAEHTKLKRYVALKSLPAHRRQSPEAIARFEREMWAVGALDHPNIVRAFDAGEHNGRHYLVMEFVNGVDVGLLASQCGCLSFADACEIIRQAAVGLEHAHESGLVHRDIKPSNLMLTEAGVVKILDLGLALANRDVDSDGELTRTGAVIGTIDYMAPEQAESTHEVDIRADIYSLGATLYRLLSGGTPFSGHNFDTFVKKVRALATHVPEPIGRVRPDIPPVLAAIVEKMLAKDPAARYSSPGEVAEALAPFCHAADLPSLTRRGVSAEESTWDRVDSDAASTMRAVPKYFERKPRSPDSPLQPAGPEPIAPPKSRNPFWIVIASCGALLIAGLSVVIFLQTQKGQIEIEIHDPDIKVALEDDGATFQGVDTTHSIRVTPGEHGLKINYGDFSFDTDKFVLHKGQTIRLKVSFRPGKLEVTSSDGAFDWSADITGWRSLFDGKTFAGWNGIEKKVIHVGWTVQDGAIVGPGNATCIGTEDEFEDFELEFEWYVGDGANGGIFYRWDGGYRKTSQLLVFAPEYQIIDNRQNLDGGTAELSCGSVFGLYPPSCDKTRPTPQWNSGRIVVSGNNVEHWVNGERVLTYQLKSDDWYSRIKKQQHLQPEQEFGGLAKGRIALQSFIGEIRYRNLRIRPLPAGSADKSKN